VAELVRVKVDLIIASDTAATRAAMQATQTIPIVIVGVRDPVGDKLIANLARPGGNVARWVVQLSNFTAGDVAVSRRLFEAAREAVVLTNSVMKALDAELRLGGSMFSAPTMPSELEDKTFVEVWVYVSALVISLTESWPKGPRTRQRSSHCWKRPCSTPSAATIALSTTSIGDVTQSGSRRTQSCWIVSSGGRRCCICSSRRESGRSGPCRHSPIR